MEAVKPRAAGLRPALDLRKDRRRNKRVNVQLNGRFLAESGDDHTLLTDNISCGGAAFVSPQKPAIGSRVVCYLDDLGRIESDVVRHTGNGFAVKFNVSPTKQV